MDIDDIIALGFTIDFYNGDVGSGHSTDNKNRLVRFTLSTGKVEVTENDRVLLNARTFDKSKLAIALSTLV